VSALSLLFDIMFLSSLAFLVLVSDEFALLPVTFVLIGIIVQAVLLRRFKRSQLPEWRIPFLMLKTTVETTTCQYCERAISADAKICRFCLTEVDGHPAPASGAPSQEEIIDLQRKNERWLADTNAV
jgi:hypothetical protein